MADGGFIHRFISKSGPRTLLLLHGTGGNENDLLPLADSLDRTSSVLSIRGKVLENGMPRYFRRLAPGVFDIEDLKFRTGELADFVLFAAKEYSFDPASVVAVGYSNGANIAASILLLRPEIIESAILFRAMLPLVPESLPDLAGKRVFISAGKFDSIIPKSTVIELGELLQKANAEVTLSWEESDHTLTENEVMKAHDWLKT